MISFIDRRGVILAYEPQTVDGRWAWERLRAGEVRISRTFRFRRSDLLQEPAENDFGRDEPFIFRFRFARREGRYNRIEGRMLGAEGDVLIAREVELERRLFSATRDISVFRRISHAIGRGREIVVGGDRPDAIPFDAFERLLRRFPGSGELDRYADARIADIVGEYVDGMRDARGHYEAYLNRRGRIVEGLQLDQRALFELEVEKYIYIRDTIAGWLSADLQRCERDWQDMLGQFLLLIFPRYVAILPSISIVDSYSRPNSATRRQMDLALVDAAGNMDVIEIKRPDVGPLLARSPYRGNGVPSRELAGAIMQAEKYLFHLTKWGVDGERDLTRRHRSKLPPGMRIRITSPKAIIILGRDEAPPEGDHVGDRSLDLEVIRRKYANVVDVLTYDDLLRRLDNVIASLRMRVETDTG